MEKRSSRGGMQPVFFKIITQPRADTMTIPPLFMKHFGHDLSKLVVLKGPREPAMEVKLIKSDEGAWFGTGWKEFKKRHSLEYAYLLTFHYEGNSQFRVVIFNYNSIQIDYSAHSSNVDVKHERETDEDEEVESDDMEEDSVEILKKNPGSSVRRKNLHIHAKQKAVAFHAGHTSRLPINIEESEEVESDGMEEDSVEMLKKNPGSSPRRKNLRILAKRLTAHQKALAFHAGHTSRLPFFIATMLPSNVTKGCYLTVPMTFAIENTPPDGCVTLRLDGGNKWPVKCYTHVSGKRVITTRLKGGWCKFVQDNDIKNGDACIFEVDKRYKSMWNVVIFSQD